jgi:hypothetical protein
MRDITRPCHAVIATMCLLVLPDAHHSKPRISAPGVQHDVKNIFMEYSPGVAGTYVLVVAGCVLRRSVRCEVFVSLFCNHSHSCCLC